MFPWTKVLRTAPSGSASFVSPTKEIRPTLKPNSRPDLSYPHLGLSPIHSIRVKWNKLRKEGPDAHPP